MRSFNDVFRAFGGPAALAAQIGVQGFHATLMEKRGSIPPRYWLATAAAAKRLGIKGVTLELFASLVAADQPGSLKKRNQHKRAAS